MSYNTTRPNPRSNWKRPKPKIYDCNRRDFENLYKPSYDEYLSTKADRESRRIDRENRGGAEGIARRFEQRRANSLAVGDDDFSSRRTLPHQETESTFRHQITSTSNGNAGNEFARSSNSASRQVRFSKNDADDTNGADVGYEERMERIRKLRADMGLPATVGGASNSDSRFSSTVESSSSTRRRESPIEDRSSRFMKTESSNSRAEHVSRKSPTHSDYDSKSSYSSKYDTTSGQNGHDDSTKAYSWRSKVASALDDDSSNGYTYTPNKPKAKTMGSDDREDFSSYESSVTSKLKDRKRVEKPSFDGIDFDDDTLLKDLTERRKNIPSSADILERIKNMDMD